MQARLKSLTISLAALLIILIAFCLLQYESEPKTRFKQISPHGWHLKDSFSFLHDGNEYMLCTDISNGGLALLKRNESGLFQAYSSILKGERSWAPIIFEDYIFYAWAPQNMSNEYALMRGMRIYYLRYDVNTKTITQDPKELAMPEIAGPWIDPEIVYKNGTYTLFIVNPRYNFDIYWCQSQNLLGPYTAPKKLENITEYGVEEAPRYDANTQTLYWSVESSDYGSTIRRGQIIIELNRVWVQEDPEFVISAFNSVTCTHPDLSPNGSLRATLKSVDNWWFIGESATEEKD
jgi:hypothetical protein